MTTVGNWEGRGLPRVVTVQCVHSYEGGGDAA